MHVLSQCSNISRVAMCIGHSQCQFIFRWRSNFSLYSHVYLCTYTFIYTIRGFSIFIDLLHINKLTNAHAHKVCLLLYYVGT